MNLLYGANLEIETMANRKLVISNCNDCPFYDNHYYTYDETCTKLNRKVDTSKEPIPEDCPLEPTEEEPTE